MKQEESHDIVTGGAGFVGRHLVRELLDAGRKVTIIDRRSPGMLQRLEGCRWVEGDIRDRDLLDEALSLEPVEHLYHLAALTGVRTPPEHERELHEVNVSGTVSVARAANDHGVSHMVFTSSSSVYGDADTYPTPETAELRPLSPYADSKARAEEILAASGGEESKTSYTSVRLFTVFGPGGRPGMAIPTFVRHALAGRSLPLFGSPESFRDYTHVRDAVHGLIETAKGPQRGSPVNIASGRAVRLLDLVAAIERIVGETVTISRQPRHARDVFGTHADITLARQLGYRPRVRLFEGLEEIVAQQRAAPDSAVGRSAPMHRPVGEERE